MDLNDVRQQWADRSGEYSPEYYAYYGPDETSDAVRRRLEGAVDRTAPVLELGCSSGRHLAHLADNGFETLAGIEVNDDAFDVMADTYPDLAADGTFYADAIENVVRDFDDDQFGAVYSVETLQHLHRDVEWVFDELARITDEVLITVENEGGDDETSENEGGDEPDERIGADTDDGEDENENPTAHTQSIDAGVNYVKDEFPLYYRDWNAIFTERGFTEVDAESIQQDTIRTFRSTSDSSAANR